MPDTNGIIAIRHGEEIPAVCNWGKVKKVQIWGPVLQGMRELREFLVEANRHGKDIQMMDDDAKGGVDRLFSSAN